MHTRRAVVAAAFGVLALTSLSACTAPEPVRLADHLVVDELSATMQIDELLPENASGFVLGCPYANVDALAQATGIAREDFRVSDRNLPGLNTDGPIALLPIVDGTVLPSVDYDTQYVSLCGTHGASIVERGSTVTFAQDGYGWWFAVSVQL